MEGLKPPASQVDTTLLSSLGITDNRARELSFHLMGLSVSLGSRQLLKPMSSSNPYLQVSRDQFQEGARSSLSWEPQAEGVSS